VNDEKLRRAFRELREREASSPPSFRDLTHPRRMPHRRRLWIARVAVLLLVIGALLIPFTKKPAPSESVGDWKSPTDFLLESPATELLESTPAIPEPVPDYSDALSIPEKGVSS
jgi:hypothetical protein